MNASTRNSFVVVLLLLTSTLTPGPGSPAGHPSLLSGSPSPADAGVNLSLALFASGLERPVDIASSGVPGDSRLFIVEQDGAIRIVQPNGTVLNEAFLEIQARVGSADSEQGLLGLVFDPLYATNGFFYVNYTDNNGDTVIARYRVRADDPQRADPASETIVLAVDQPYSNHNAGDLVFGPDGYLYIPLGDGGSGGDPQNSAQSLDELLGKVLRIEVSRDSSLPPSLAHQLYVPYVSGPGAPFLIPADNPFAVDGDPATRAEIWAWGLRNPWRISFDRLTGDLFIADVGQNEWEEINFQLAASGGGENYGWRCYEGDHAFNLAGCGPAADYVFPIAEYSHSFGCSVTGGFVYRGGLFPDLVGRYLYADYCSDRFWSLAPDGAGGWQVQWHGVIDIGNPSTFGEDIDGELYVAGHLSGQIYRIETVAIAQDQGE